MQPPPVAVVHLSPFNCTVKKSPQWRAFFTVHTFRQQLPEEYVHSVASHSVQESSALHP